MSDATGGATAPAKIYLAVPNYGTVVSETTASLITAFLTSFEPDSGYQMGHYDARHSSALTYNFNLLWCDALAKRKQGITHFVMLHSDVHAEAGWVKILLEELTRHRAGVVSAVIPIKDMRGITTTAFGKPGSLDVVRRLTVKEALRLPKTFTAADAGEPDKQLLINTGCWICDLRQPWVDQFPGFMIGNGLHEDPKTGAVTARFYSEDWMFGKWLADNGVKTMATTAVGISHFGTYAFQNSGEWGLETDPSDGPAAPLMPAKNDDPELKWIPSEGISEAAKRDFTPEEIAALEKKFYEKHMGPRAPQPEKKETGSIDRSKMKSVEWKPCLSAPTPREPTREIVAVRFAESMAWVHNWLDDILVKHGPNLTYRIYDKGPDGDTPNVGNLDGTYLLHIVNEWDRLADWTVFTQADPFPHMEGLPFASLLTPQESARFPFVRRCREWDQSGRLAWHTFPEPWKRRYETGSIKPAKVSMSEWFKEYLGVNIHTLDALEYHPGAIFGVSREAIQRRPKAFYERLLASVTEDRHPSPEIAHYLERSWSIIFSATKE